ncbi:ParE toxin of type II toxin-antitoxin system, parDE [Cyclonatronum proteinivorum]|uniref:ParE toxin of type II toxin-antitoxin system, parDE n=1 Tax=Cyclonatronum proteinivorum TaxID=1457365 RepID=A0A345UJM2_9BACT|nr:type II toxin-antitoxin system RelE/ParE family toxin [Cyclonatronum proteinivorum]AXJ00674.1 ParE toxin of type II toxin-antitoxin system, parDE [Cyclonatronum proteinivorum]
MDKESRGTTRSDFRLYRRRLTLYTYRTVQKIIGRVEKIPLYPFKGRMVPEYERDDIREVFHHPYRIIYMVRPELTTIEIISIIHSSRLLPDEMTD